MNNENQMNSKPQTSKPSKIVVAMSGGVDSSVAAALLKEKGYDVIGVTMQVWPASQNVSEIENFKGCCSLNAVEDARRVARTIDIPYYVLNFRDVFQEKVIDNFISEYKNGRTPNPCIRCNQFIKFDVLLQKTRELEAYFVATGHYARIKFDKKKKRYLLFRGRDKNKDQSYMLYVLTQKQLARILMPLAEFKKEDTRKIAKELGLRVADKPESQEICFIPDNNYRRFLKDKIPQSFSQGDICNCKGEVIGRHQGILNYTVGQRKGLDITSKEPQYVLAINKQENTIIAGSRKYLGNKGLVAKDVNLIAFEELNHPINVTAQVRYNMEPVKATIAPCKGSKIEVIFDNPQDAITPGQAVVFYDGDLVLGGATIEKPLE